MARRNVILFGLLIAQLFLVVLVFWPREVGRAATGSLFDGLSTDAVAALTIDDGSAPIRIVRAGTTWGLPDAGDFPVAEAKVTALISDVLAIDTGRLVASSPASHGRLKVAGDNYVHRVELETAGGERFVLFVGTAPNASTVHVRRDGQDEVYLADGRLAANARSDLANWIDTQLLALSADMVKALTVRNARGSYTLSRDSTGAWRLDGIAAADTLDQVAVNGLVGKLAGATMARPLGKVVDSVYGLDEPSATVVITVQPAGGTAQTTTLTIGAADEIAGTYVVKSSASEYFVAVPQFQLQDFVTKGRTELEATAAPAATPSLTGTQVLTATRAVTP